VSGDTWHVVGEVVNNGAGASKRADGIHLYARFFDATGEVASASGTTAITVIPGAGDEPQFGSNDSPFHLSAPAPQGKTLTAIGVDILSAAIPSGGDIVRGLQVVPSSPSMGAVFSASGFVNNTSSVTYHDITVIAVLRDVFDDIVRVAETNTAPSSLDAGETATFSVTIPDPPAGIYTVEWRIDAVR
jgi:hypothetical protein